MDNIEQLCELCGDDKDLDIYTLHIDRDDDSVIHNKACVCIHCFTRFETNLEMFIAISEIRVAIQEIKEQELDDEPDQL